jgi:hypothetical protein
MDLLDPIYWRLLTHGLIAIRGAAEAGDLPRCRVEAEHIHNIPSLIGEANIQRHVYYATTEREAYIEWVLSTGRKELRDHALFLCSLAWREMDTVLGLRGASYEERLSRESEKGGQP